MVFSLCPSLSQGVLSFRPVLFQPHKFQTPVQLEVILKDVIGMVYVFHENGKHVYTLINYNVHVPCNEMIPPNSGG